MAGSGRSEEGWGRRSVVAAAGERGIEGRPWACAMACAFVATAASRSAIEAEQGRSEEEACCSDDGMGGKVSGACKRGTHGQAVLAGTAQRAAPGLAPLALP